MATLLEDSEASAQLVEIARKVMKKRKEQQDQNPDIPKAEEKKKRRYAETVDVLFAELLQETSDERIKLAVATVRGNRFQPPATDDARVKICYLASWLRGCASTVGFVWERITAEAEAFITDILRQHLDTHAITTVIRKKDVGWGGIRRYKQPGRTSRRRLATAWNTSCRCLRSANYFANTRGCSTVRHLHAYATTRESYAR